MIKTFSYIILLSFSFWSHNAYSQSNCTVPSPPVLTSVSVQPESGRTDFTWNLSPSSDVAGYILYSYKNGDGMPLDTIWDPTATSFTLTSTATKYFSVSYVVTAHRLSVIPGMPGCTSPFSNLLNTIFCSSEIDTCNKKILVKWNRYADFPKPVREYQILVGINGGPLSVYYTTSRSSDNYTISDFSIDSQYCIVVRAVLEDGTISNSNKSCLSTKMQRPPGWINADYATINNENKISLSFSIDPLSEITLFGLEKKSGPSGVFQEISKPLSVNGKVMYTDNSADIDVVNYYRLSAINSCNLHVTLSNLSSNMVLSLTQSGDDIVLNWNPYKNWLGIVSSYHIFINTGSGFEDKVVVTSTDTTYTLGYKSIMYDISDREICFNINAIEISNPYGIAGQSISSKVCSVPTELITVPNVFTPDNDLVNDLFRPVLSFTPFDYDLIISDRRGNVLFETKDFNESWDGSGNGNPQLQDVCLWFLRLTTPSGKKITRTGTVTIIKKR